MHAQIDFLTSRPPRTFQGNVPFCSLTEQDSKLFLSVPKGQIIIAAAMKAIYSKAIYTIYFTIYTGAGHIIRISSKS